MIDPKLFPPDVIAGAQLAHKNTGVPIAVTLAQYALESDYGKKVTGDFNYWGEKWKPGCRYPFKECPTHEDVHGKEIPETDKFVSFPSSAASFEFQAWCLTNSHGPYAKARPFLKSWRSWLHMISRTYSTDPRYEQKICDLIAQYHLDAIDA